MTRFLIALTLLAAASPAMAQQVGKCADEAQAASLAMSAGMNPVLRVHGKSGKAYVLGVGPAGNGLLVGRDPEGCYRYLMPIPPKAVKAIRLGVGEPV